VLYGGSRGCLTAELESRVLLGSIVAVGLLALSLLVHRSERDAAAPPSGPGPWSARPSSMQAWLGALAVLAAGAPLWVLAPWSSPDASLGDAITHARVSAELAATGLPHGWIQSYLGGFPFGVHYPPLGWTLASFLVWLGASPLDAVNVLGWCGTVATPLALYAGVVRVGARPIFAVPGALALAWVAPSTSFVGGYEAYFQVGLLSQAIALPFCILLASFVARSERAWPAAGLAALAMLAHPQLAVASLLVLGAACAAAGDRAALVRWARACAGALALGLGLYGPGVATLQIPFGWPELGWRQLGFAPSRAVAWLRDGELLDMRRPIVLTDLALVAMLAALLQARRPAARAALLSIALSLAIPLTGRALEAGGALGAAVPAVPQPLRAIALVPVAVGVLFVVSLEEAAPRVERMLLRHHATVSRYAAAGSAALLAVILLHALPDRLAWARNRASLLAGRRVAPCDGFTPEGYDHAETHRWMRELSGGRLWYTEAEPQIVHCMHDDALQLSSAVPLGVTLAVGSHVGVQWSAFSRIDLDRPGSDRRAEAVGVRWALTLRRDQAPVGWRQSRERGPVQLWTHDRPTRLVGAGCVRQSWRGTNAALRSRLLAELDTDEGASLLLSPDELVALEITGGPVVVEPAEDGGCDATGAEITEVREEPGAVRANIVARAPIDVVVRVTSFAGWTLRLDDRPVSRVLQVAPGFLATRVPAGTHRIEATAGPAPGHPWALVPGLAGLALAAFGRRRQRTSVNIRSQRSSSSLDQ